ncbi:MAG: hypothetical protein JW807_08905 [Spirochaetes bacterium]|nr:hypothetical protein [Spirochaetota bacterium]
MLKQLPLYIRFALITGALTTIVIANSREQGFREKLLDYIYFNSQTEDIKLLTIDPSNDSYLDYEYDSFSYRSGDWEDYVISSRYRNLGDRDERITVYRGDDVAIHTYGSLNLDLNYGKSIFTKKRYQEYNEDKALSQVIKEGFRPTQDLQLHVEGNIGDRMTVYIDHDSRKKDNIYQIKYRAIRDDELIRELNAGDIDINFQGSKYAVYDNNTAKGLGVDLTLQKNKFTFKAFGSVTKGNTEVETFHGNSTPGNMKLSEYQYIRGEYYQIEPLIRYDNRLVPPYPSGYSLQAVNLNPYGFELYMDDQNPYNNQSAIQISTDHGYYTRLRSGVDYKINYTTGLVQFLAPVSERARIFAAYTLLGASTDPNVLHPGDPGHPGGSFGNKLVVFIKYGYSLADAPVPSQDIYEVRSFYFIGDRYILPGNFNISFFLENGVMSRQDITSLGHYTVDYKNGIIQFVYREPFKQLLLANGTDQKIYVERQTANVYDYSRYKIRVDYYKEARSFQLAHMNIIPDSVVVKVDGRTIPESLYTIDYTAGYITFKSGTNPLIGPRTIIEVRYEYLPLSSQEQQFIGGFRTEYEFSRDLKVGGSVLYSRSSGEDSVPVVGSEPTQTVFFEGDATLHLDGRRLAQLANMLTRERRRELPIEINGYAEFAKSYKNVNTFGKALVDNMESTEDMVSLSLNERDWILSSRPSSLPVGSVRGILNYLYYRSLGSLGTLNGILYPAAKVDYSIKAGPYNVATGHLHNSIMSLVSQRSLVMDFGNSPLTGTADFVSIVTRRLSKEAVDLSSIQYVEISYLYDGPEDTSLSLDLGRINEDSDGNARMNTEDVNGNGVIDSDPNTGFSEDIGYAFNEAGHPSTRVGGGPGVNKITRGDGVLNSEDLNENGILDMTESVYSFDGQSVTLAASEKGWKLARIYINHATLTESQINILKGVESIRLNITRTGAATGMSGRLYIDGIRFISSKWRETRLDAAAASPDQLKVTAINNMEDSEYTFESFSILMKDIYKSMYAVKNDDDLMKERETALKMEYSVPAGSASVSATRRFAKPMDFSHYKTLTAWVNFRSFSSGDRVGVIIGSSDTDFIVYKMNMQFPHVWREMKMRLQSSSEGLVFPSSITGLPDMKRITFIKLLVYSTAPPSNGELWVNEIYLEEPQVLDDSAHWYEGEIKITKPMFRTKGGVPILSDASVKYIQKGHTANFSTIGKPDQDIAEEYRQVFSSFTIMPNWNAKIDYIREDSDTDSLNELVEEARRGKTRKNSVMVATDYSSTINGVPSIKLMYKYEDYNNKLDERITNYLVVREKTQYNHAPVISYRQSIDRFLWGKLMAEFYMDMLFKRDEIKRESFGLALKDIVNTMSLLEIEKRQRTDARFNLDYTNRYFYIRPGIQAASEEVVTYMGQSEANRTEILYGLMGDYHFPFVYNDDCKFVERNKMFSLSAGLGDFWFIAPGCKVDIQYFENRFSDYEIDAVPEFGYQREKDGRTLVSSAINIPVFLHKIKAISFIKSFSVSYNRSLYFSEIGVPYEGEKKNPYDERFGITRTVGRLADAGFNMFQYHPFYFFLGRKNYANGRDYVYTTMNLPVRYINQKIVPEYNNNLRLLDNFAASWSVDLKRVTITSNSGLSQICERQNVFGLPSQVVSANFDISANFDLMKFFHFWFFRPNREGIPYHAAFMTVGYRFETNMLITQNIEETVHTPDFGLSFKRDRKSLTIEFGVNLKRKKTVTYISWNPLNRSFKDQKYIDNMPLYAFYKDTDTGYSLSVLFETDVIWIYKFFSLFYRLVASPIFTLEYSMKLNRYDYLLTASPQPYDLHLITSRLTLDLHKNLQGGLNAKLAVEQYRNSRSIYNYLNVEHIRREIFSFEIGGHFTLLF